MAKRKIPSLHPGRILLGEFLEPLGLSQYRLAKDIGVPQTRIAGIVRGRRRITADTALRLARYFRMSERIFLNLQTHYDIEMEKMKFGPALVREVRTRGDLGVGEAPA